MSSPTTVQPTTDEESLKVYRTHRDHFQRRADEYQRLIDQIELERASTERPSEHPSS